MLPPQPTLGKSRIADQGEPYPDPDPTLGKKPGSDRQAKTESDPRKPFWFRLNFDPKNLTP